MSAATPPGDPSASHASPHAELVEELERRIEEIEGLDDTQLGRFTSWDWVICVVGAVLVPALTLWWFAA